MIGGRVVSVMQANMLSAVLRTLGVTLAVLAFGLALGGALMAGVDPLWALLRAAIACAALMTTYSILCKLVIPIATTIGASGKESK